MHCRPGGANMSKKSNKGDLLGVHDSDKQAKGDIAQPGTNDVVFGRGGDTNYHIGNHRFRALIADRFKARYREATTRTEKSTIAKEVVNHWRLSQVPPGRFLARMNPSKGSCSLWYEVGDGVAVKKAIKILGEKSRRAHSAQAEAKRKSSSSSKKELPTDEEHTLSESLEWQMQDGSLAGIAAAGEISPLSLEEGTQQELGPAAAIPTAENGSPPDKASIPSAAALTDVFDSSSGSEKGT